jgi:hypothetical protein
MNLFHTVLIVASFYALTHAFKEGWIFNRPRAFLIRLHPFFYYLFECWACTGFHAGWMIYFIVNPLSHFDWREMIIWGLASSGISYIMNVIVDRVSR